MKNTKISYMYRDAANYKAHNEEVLKGELTLNQISEIIEGLTGGEYFIPSAVGLPDLQSNLDSTDSDELDHDFHELNFTDFESTTKKPTIGLTAIQLYNNFKFIENEN